MNNRRNNLLKAITLADRDNRKNIEVSMDDLLFLKDMIIGLEAQKKALQRDVNILSGRLALRELDRPVKLSCYA